MKVEDSVVVVVVVIVVNFKGFGQGSFKFIATLGNFADDGEYTIHTPYTYRVSGFEKVSLFKSLFFPKRSMSYHTVFVEKESLVVVWWSQ